jgi:cell fate regulator YaaT (PSP1 superfamily)
MGCSGCGTSNGKPNGCKSNGGCSSGGCNRMNVHDWLVNLPFADPNGNCNIVELSFNNGSRKDFFRNTTLQYFEKGEMVAVEGVSGFDVGMVSMSGELVRLQLKKYGVREENPEIKKILRRANELDLKKMAETKEREPQALTRARAIARQLKLDMKLSEVELQADGRKGTFFYIADDRVDFRELIKIYASEFKVKVEMRQIGARQEAAKVGGLGSCGRELCCSTWLTDFKSVTTTAARYQNLSINQTKLSGQCGRLKCCLNFELDTYLDALQYFPDNVEVLQLSRGNALLVKKDIFKNLLWYVMADSSKHYPLSIERVREIKRMNMEGHRPDELQPVEVISSKPREVEPEFVDVVGQISLRSLDKKDRDRRRQQQQQRRGGQQQGGNQQGGQQQRRDGGQRQQGNQQGGQQQRRDNRNQQQGGGQQQQRRDNRNQQQGGNQQQRRDNRPHQRPQQRQGGSQNNSQKEGGDQAQ